MKICFSRIRFWQWVKDYLNGGRKLILLIMIELLRYATANNFFFLNNSLWRLSFTFFLTHQGNVLQIYPSSCKRQKEPIIGVRKKKFFFFLFLQCIFFSWNSTIAFEQRTTFLIEKKTEKKRITREIFVNRFSSTLFVT